jgi:MbtH protein
VSIDSEDTIFQVVVNDEEQYSIWPAEQGLPAGWRAEGPLAPKQQCLDYIDEKWTDMRPLTVRRQFEADVAVEARR